LLPTTLNFVARYFDVHPHNPQPRAISQVVELLRADGLIAYPTDSCFALGCQLDNRSGLDRIREIRQLDNRHHFTLVCADFNQLGRFVHLDNVIFRALKASTPGQYTFIVPASREVPKRMLQPRRRTVGVRIPDHAVAQAIIAGLGEPLVSSTLIMPGENRPLTQGWEIMERLDHLLDAVVDSGECGEVPTTVVDLSDGQSLIIRRGAGDPARFE
jgi:tRNA threonylcarbamoyl adenosine modification protein (Sua5/YciO/YrdC/YwlC family)